MNKKYVNIKAEPHNLNYEAVSQWAKKYLKANEDSGHYTKDLYDHYCEHGSKKMASGFFTKCLLKYLKENNTEYGSARYGKRSTNGTTVGVIYNLELIETQELPVANSVF